MPKGAGGVFLLGLTPQAALPNKTRLSAWVKGLAFLSYQVFLPFCSVDLVSLRVGCVPPCSWEGVRTAV